MADSPYLALDVNPPPSILSSLGAIAQIRQANAQAALTGQQAQIGAMKLSALNDYMSANGTSAAGGGGTSGADATGSPPNGNAFNRLAMVDPAWAKGMVDAQQTYRQIGAQTQYAATGDAAALKAFPDVYKTVQDSISTAQGNQRAQVIQNLDIGGRAANIYFSGGRTVQSWNNALDFAQTNGLIPPDQAAQYRDKPNDMMASRLAVGSIAAKDWNDTTTAPTGSNVFTKGSLLGPGMNGGQQAPQPGGLSSVGQPSPDNIPSPNGNYAPGAVTTAALPAQGGGSAPQASSAAPFSPEVAQAIRTAQQKHGITSPAFAATAFTESRGDPNATNASGAAGLFQLMPPTAKQYGLNATTVMDPNLNADAAARLWNSNAATLKGELGRAPTDGEIYLAHQQGALGAAQLLQNPNAPAASVLGLNAVQENLPPSMQAQASTMTAGQFANLWTSKFDGGSRMYGAFSQPGSGGAAPIGGSADPTLTPGAVMASAQRQGIGGAPTAAIAPAAPPASAGVQQQPSPVVPTAPANVPAGVQPIAQGPSYATQAEQTGYGSTLGQQPAQLAADADASRQQNALVDQMRVASQSFKMGDWAKANQVYNKTMQSVAEQWGLPAGNFTKPAADYEEFQKDAMQLTATAVKQVSSQAAAQEFSQIQKALPSADMTRTGFNQVADQIQGINDYKIAKQQAGQAYLDQNKTMAGFGTDWNSKVSPTAFIVMRMPAQDAQYMHDQLAKTPEGQALNNSIVRQLNYLHQSGLAGS